MKNFKSIILLIAMLLIPPSLVIAGNPYVSFNSGLSNPEGFNSGLAVGGSGGYDFGFFRVEGEYLNLSNKADATQPGPIYIKKAKWGKKPPKKTGQPRREDNRDLIFINALVDVPIYKKLEFYFGGGYAFPEYQLMTGLRVNIAEALSVGGGYRFIEGSSGNYKNHALVANITYYFGGM